jgi:hypothetical protein
MHLRGSLRTADVEILCYSCCSMLGEPHLIVGVIGVQLVAAVVSGSLVWIRVCCTCTCDLASSSGSGTCIGDCRQRPPQRNLPHPATSVKLRSLGVRLADISFQKQATQQQPAEQMQLFPARLAQIANCACAATSDPAIPPWAQTTAACEFPHSIAFNIALVKWVGMPATSCCRTGRAALPRHPLKLPRFCGAML